MNVLSWWEASWANVIVTGVLALVAITVLWAALEELPLRRAVPHQPPAGGEDRPGFPPSRGGSLLPGRIIPRPPATHECGGIVRLIEVREGGCIWLWRAGSGWQQLAECAVLPTDEEWNLWARQLWEGKA